MSDEPMDPRLKGFLHTLISGSISLVMLALVAGGGLGAASDLHDAEVGCRGYEVVSGPDASIGGLLMVVMVIALIAAPLQFFAGIGMMCEGIAEDFPWLRQLSVRGILLCFLAAFVVLVLPKGGLVLGGILGAIGVLAIIYRALTSRSLAKLLGKALDKA